MTDDVERRLLRVEEMLDNGRFIRRETFEVIAKELGNDYARLEQELGGIRQVIEADRRDRAVSLADERKARENDRRSLRNLVLAAFAAGLVSIAVSFITAAVSRPPT